MTTQMKTGHVKRRIDHMKRRIGYIKRRTSHMNTQQRKIWISALKNKGILLQAKGCWNPTGVRRGKEWIVASSLQNEWKILQAEATLQGASVREDEKETQQRNPYNGDLALFFFKLWIMSPPHLLPSVSQEFLSVSSSLGCSTFLSHSPISFLSLSPVLQLCKVSFACLLIRSPEYPVAIIQVQLTRRATG